MAPEFKRLYKIRKQMFLEDLECAQLLRGEWLQLHAKVKSKEKEELHSTGDYEIWLVPIYHIWQNFRVGKLSWLCTKYTIHWKTFAVHQSVAIMYSVHSK